MSSATATIAPLASSDPDLAQQLSAMSHKIDQLHLQMNHLYQRSVALEELKDELVHIAKDAMGALQVELSEVEHEFNTDAIVHLLRKAVRSTPRLIRLFETLETAQDLMDELGPLSKEVVRDLVDRLQVWEERGYFRIARGGVQLLDRVAEHASEEDIAGLADNVTRILDTVKQTTQPKMLQIASSAAGVLQKKNGATPPPVGLFGMVKAMRDPEVQAGMGVLVELLRHVAHDDSNKET